MLVLRYKDFIFNYPLELLIHENRMYIVSIKKSQDKRIKI